MRSNPISPEVRKYNNFNEVGFFYSFRFITETNLKNHEKSHLLDEMKHECDVCDKKFASKHSLVNHKRGHAFRK